MSLLHFCEFFADTKIIDKNLGFPKNSKYYVALFNYPQHDIQKLPTGNFLSLTKQENHFSNDCLIFSTSFIIFFESFAGRYCFLSIHLVPDGNSRGKSTF